jgi:hypothetical protein
MKTACIDVAFVALQFLALLVVVTCLSIPPAWSTFTRYSYFRCNEERSTRLQVFLAESSSEVATKNRLTTLAATSSTRGAIKRPKHSIHLLSLPPTDDAFTKQGEFLVRECWKWKDSALGDGRDYFIPRPRVLKAFHALFVGMTIDVVVHTGIVDVMLTLPSAEGGQSESEVRLNLPLEHDRVFTHEVALLSSKESSFSERYVIEECVALSNCARLDVVLVLKHLQWSNNLDSCMQNIRTNTTAIAAQFATAFNLYQQIHSQRSKVTSILERAGLASWLDMPGIIQTPTTNSITQEQFTEIKQLCQRLVSIEGSRSISTHLCLVACGLAPRSNRPDRVMIFRPYSSRDARE